MNIESVFREIVNEIGISGILQEGCLLGAFSDIAPQMTNERKLLALFIESKGHISLINALDYSDEDKRHAVNNVVERMHEEHFIDESISKELCIAFLHSIVGKVNSKQINGDGHKLRMLNNSNYDGDLLSINTPTYSIVECSNKKLWRQILSWNNLVSVSSSIDFAIGLKNDGTIISHFFGIPDSKKKFDLEYASKWEGIKDISCGIQHFVGLRSNGTVVACGSNGFGQCNVNSWRNVKRIVCGDFRTVALCTDGSVLSTEKVDQENFSSINDAINVAVGFSRTIIQTKQNVKLFGSFYNGKVLDWDNLKDIAISGRNDAFGLTKDGTILSYFYDSGGMAAIKSKLSHWSGIVSIYYIDLLDTLIGLKADGTVCAETCDERKKAYIKEINNWSGIDKISTGLTDVFGLRRDYK